MADVQLSITLPAQVDNLQGRLAPGTDRLAPLLDELSDHERIASVADAVIECETAEELLARAENA